MELPFAFDVAISNYKKANALQAVCFFYPLLVISTLQNKMQ